MQFINDLRNFEFNSEIIEWDIRKAGINIIKEYKLLPIKKIEKLLTLPKKTMDIQIGQIGKDDKEFAKTLEDKFNEVVNIFIDENSIDKSYDIISVKRDAVFVINKPVNKSKFGEFIEFIPKNTYDSYLYIKPFEFYIKSNNDIDIKGIGKDKLIVNTFFENNKDGILNLILETFGTAKRSNNNLKDMNQFFSEIVKLYKTRELPFDYYREFKVGGGFTYWAGDDLISLDSIDESFIDNISIEYNYINFILPLIRLTCLK